MSMKAIFSCTFMVHTLVTRIGWCKDVPVPRSTNKSTLLCTWCWWWSFHMLEHTVGPMDTEADVEHVALFHTISTVAVRAIFLLTHSMLCKVPAHWHPVWVILMQEGAGVAFHAQVLQPVPAHCLQLHWQPPMQPSGFTINHFKAEAMQVYRVHLFEVLPSCVLL